MTEQTQTYSATRNQPLDLEDPRVIAAVEAYLAALETGHKPDRQAFLLEHADIAGVLAECLDALQFVHSVTPRLQARRSESTSAPGELGPATPLGDFQIVDEIGRGGMGVVYEAIQLSLSRRVALKVLPFAAALDARQLQRFKNEAQAAACLHHTNIVPVFGVGQERGVHFYAMQFIEGNTLAEQTNQMRRQAGLKEPADAKPVAQAETAPYPPPERQDSAPAPSTQSLAAATTQHSHKSHDYFRAVA
jgi:hypothetical protein